MEYPAAAFGYIRVSSFREQQRDEGISPEVQELAIRQFGAAHGIRIIDVISDLNINGGRERFLKRKILPTIERIKAREADAAGVIVYNLSRWGRSQIESMISEAELKEAGGILLSTSEPNDTANAAGEFGRNILHGVAQLQRSIISDSWRSAHEARYRAGLPKDGKPRFGYLYKRDKENGARYEIDPERGPLLTQAYQRYLAGETLWSIATRYQSAGVTQAPSATHPEQTPGIITYSILERAMRSGFGAGLIISDARSATPSWRPGKQDPLITDAEWEAYKAKTFGVVKRRGPQAIQFPLRGLVFCGSCKGTMGIYSLGGGQYKLACRTRSAGITTTIKRECPSPVGVRAAIVEEAVREWLRAHNKTDVDASRKLVERQLKALKIQSDAAALQAKLESVQSFKLNLARNHARGGLSDSEYDALRSEADAEEAELTASIAEANRTIRVHLIPPADAFDAVLHAWEQGIGNSTILNVALQQVIRGVYVGRGKSASSPDKFDIIAAWEDREPDVFLGGVRNVDHEAGKYCSRCLEWKNADGFYRRKSGKDSGSLTSWCRECTREYLRTKRTPASQADRR